MDGSSDVRAVTRRFLQNRRRDPFSDAEITQLLTDDAEYIEVIGDDRWTVVGPQAIVTLMRRFWSGLAAGAEMSVIRHTILEDGTAVGHWRREQNGEVVNGRDTYTLRDGRICRIVVEEFSDVRIPESVAINRAT
ncbi:MAG TPA: nuclear transport factor 2 family protein [Euzebya sp.]|nr:nuclear transport factor 2 family protein [Euzebya sp.]